MQCYSKTAAEHFICVKAHRILVFNKEIAGLWFVFRICQGDYGTHTWVGWGKGFQAVSPPFCLWGLITHQWTVSRSTDWELSGTSLTRRWQYQMEKLHTCSSCFHYPSAGHWPSTKSLRLFSLPGFRFYCGTCFPSHPFTATPPHSPSLQTLSLLKSIVPSFQRHLKSSKTFYAKKKP